MRQFEFAETGLADIVAGACFYLLLLARRQELTLPIVNRT